MKAWAHALIVILVLALMMVPALLMAQTDDDDDTVDDDDDATDDDDDSTDVIFEESFDDGLTSGTTETDWMVEDTTESGVMWTSEDTQNRGGNFTLLVAPFAIADTVQPVSDDDDDDAADDDDDDLTNDVVNTTLTSPVIDFTNYSNATLTFDYNMSFEDGDSAGVWVVVDDAPTAVMALNTTEENTASVDISTYAGGLANVRFQFTYNSTISSDVKGGGWLAIDNIVVTESAPADDDDTSDDDSDDTEVSSDDDEEDSCGCWLTRRDDDPEE